MRIKLLPTTAEQTAKDILNGILPSETNDLEVLSWLAHFDPNLIAYRIDGCAEVEFTANMIKIAIERDIEIRPEVLENLQEAIA
jgi:hypothetical protein